MLQQKELVLDAPRRAFVDEPLLERVRVAVVDQAQPTSLERRRIEGRRAHGSGSIEKGGHARTIAGVPLGFVRATGDPVVPVRGRRPGRCTFAEGRVAYDRSPSRLRRSDRYRMSAYLVRPRSSIADPELARVATVDLPTGRSIRDMQPPQALLDAVASLRKPTEPELPIVLTLAPVPARSQR